jgi:hypothetical protein
MGRQRRSRRRAPASVIEHTPDQGGLRMRRAARQRTQSHFELVASEKLLTALTTFAASVAIDAICVADGLDGSPLMVLSSAVIDDWIALV